MGHRGRTPWCALERCPNLSAEVKKKIRLGEDTSYSPTYAYSRFYRLTKILNLTDKLGLKLVPLEIIENHATDHEQTDHCLVGWGERPIQKRFV